MHKHSVCWQLPCISLLAKVFSGASSSLSFSLLGQFSRKPLSGSTCDGSGVRGPTWRIKAQQRWGRNAREVGNWPRVSLGWVGLLCCDTEQCRGLKWDYGKEGIQTGCQSQWDGAGMCMGHGIQRNAEINIFNQIFYCQKKNSQMWKEGKILLSPVVLVCNQGYQGTTGFQYLKVEI